MEMMPRKIYIKMQKRAKWWNLLNKLGFDTNRIRTNWIRKQCEIYKIEQEVNKEIELMCKGFGI